MDKIGLISVSDGKRLEQIKDLKKLEAILLDMGFTVIYAETIYRKGETPFSGTPKKRADALMALFVNPEVKAIFDLSGGDSANQILPFLDYDLIAKHPKPFFGLSDLTVILNSLYKCSNLVTYHYQLLNLIEEHSDEQRKLFKELMEKSQGEELITYDYSFLRGNNMSGVVIGGNIRCFLKLAGTKYMPDPKNKILFLESLGGGANRMASLLAQLDQLGFFKVCKGILLGTFTEMKNKHLLPTIEELVLEITEPYGVPVVKTNQLGHHSDAHCLPIGKQISLEEM